MRADEALNAAEKQKIFFQAVDNFVYDDDNDMKPLQHKEKDEFDKRLDRATTRLRSKPKRVHPSETVVMEAAYYLIECGLFNIPDVGTINVKQARAFLWNAAWLQEHMTAKWQLEGELAPSHNDAKAKFDDYCLAIVGPGGTGKTAILKATEALSQFSQA